MGDFSSKEEVNKHMTNKCKFVKFENFTRSTAWAALCLGLFTFGLGLPAKAEDDKPTIITFDAPGAGTAAFEGTYPNAITPAGAITGFYFDANFDDHGFLRARDGNFIVFDPVGSIGTAPFSINPTGAITGFYFEDLGGPAHGFLRAPDGTITTFDAPGAGTGHNFQGTYPYNINPAGAIAGIYQDASNVYHGFLRAPDGSITTFDAPGAGTGPRQGTFTSTEDGLNPAGALSGNYTDDANASHGFVRAPDGTFTIFNAPGAGTGPGAGTIVGGINPAGLTEGFYIDAAGLNHGFVRAADGTITTFDVQGAGTGSGQGTIAGNINTPGMIDGQFIDASGMYHGFLRSKHGVITKYDVPGAGTGSGQGTMVGISTPTGTTTGSYVDANNVVHGYLLVP